MAVIIKFLRICIAIVLFPDVNPIKYWATHIGISKVARVLYIIENPGLLVIKVENSGLLSIEKEVTTIIIQP